MVVSCFAAFLSEYSSETFIRYTLRVLEVSRLICRKVVELELSELAPKQV